MLKIAEMHIKTNDSILDFANKFKKVVRKILPTPTSAMFLAWFVSTLPKRMGIMVRQLQCKTLEKAIKATRPNKKADVSSSKRRKKRK